MTEHVGNGRTASLNWPVILFLAAQTGAGIWWASGISRTLDFITQTRANDDIRVQRDISELRDAEKTKDLEMQRLELEIQRLTDAVNNGWRPVVK